MEQRDKPVRIMDNVVAIATGNAHALALKQDGTVWAWGQNDHGQLGDGTTANTSVPVMVMEHAAAIAAGFGHSMAVQQDGTLWAWGWNEQQQLGDGTAADQSKPSRLWKNELLSPPD